MRYHVPFSQRNQQNPPGPIFIGFEQPVSIQRRKGPFNWSGFIGLILVLISPLTFFLVAPIALLFSLFGLRRAPRGMAVTGTLLSLAATSVLSLMVIGVSQHRTREHRQHREQIVATQNRSQIAETMSTLKSAEARLIVYRDEHKNFLPELGEGMDMTVQYRDSWKRELFYEPVSAGCVIRSAGPDGKFQTRDDLICKLTGLSGDRPIEGE